MYKQWLGILAILFLLPSQTEDEAASDSSKILRWQGFKVLTWD